MRYFGKRSYGTTQGMAKGQEMEIPRGYNSWPAALDNQYKTAASGRAFLITESARRIVLVRTTRLV